ncbi:MAG: dihydroneopterin aldolase [Candidatus Eisenbacteria bacterium]|nr:dihydroneopterin aldolase [Candidatus Eisenbacteria bacterium]
MDMAEYRVSLENIRLYGYHGATPSERELGQRFEVDVEISADLSGAVAEDSMKKTVNYEKVYRLVESEVVGQKYHLLETMADKIARDVLEQFGALKVTVRVRKPSVPIAGTIDHVEVEVTHTS